MQGSQNSPATCKNKKRKKMDKKFYEMPEIEVIKLQIEGALLDGSNPELDEPIPGEGGGGLMG